MFNKLLLLSVKFQASNENSNFYTFRPMGQGSKDQNPSKLEKKQVKTGVYCSKMCLGEVITSFCNVLSPFSKF